MIPALPSGGALRALGAGAVLALTVALVLLRPRGLSEAWAASRGVAGHGDVLDGVRDLWEVLLFLVSVMALAGLAEQAGVFGWAAGLALRACGGRGWLLFVTLYLLGALITLFLSLDVTAVVLTPLVCALVAPLRLDSRPFVGGLRPVEDRPGGH